MELKNLTAGDVPQGLGSVDFTARIAQPYSMDNFAYSLAAYRETNYAFSVKTTLSTRQGSDMSLTDPTVSLVAYYRPGMGCYEARAKRVSATMVELSLWKWGWQGNALTCKQIGKSVYMGRPVPTNSGIMDTTHALVNETATDSDRYMLWHTMSISAYNTSGGTVVQTRLARYRSGYSITYDHTASDQSGRYSDQRYIIVTATDNEANRLTSGAYGMGSVNCTGYFGNPRFHQQMSNSTNFQYTGTTVTELSATDLEYDWSVPSRYRQLSSNETKGFSWRPSTSVSAEQRDNGWVCGLVSKVPEQNVAIRYQLLGSTEWTDIGNVTVTNFLSTYYTFSPRVTEDCYVQLAAGGDRYDTCVDVAVDNIDINSWRGRSSDISKNYGEKDDWVYTSCWIESALGFTGAFSVEQVPGTNEYCYIFTNAGETITFTPRMDLYMSQALVVGGGGAGGWAGGGGGGGGVYAITNGTWLRAGEPVTITVGAGGNNYHKERAGYSTADVGWIQRGDSGGLSRLTIDGEDYTAYGGGGGASYYTYYGVGNNNNSGMPLATGGGNANTSQGITTRGPYGLTNKLGLGGGGDGGITMCYASGGGGGAGGNGMRGTTNNPVQKSQYYWLVGGSYGGDGGIGWMSKITGTEKYYGGGGGGGDGRIFTSYSSSVKIAGDNHIYYYWNTRPNTSTPYTYFMLDGSTGGSNLGNRAPGAGGLGGGGKGGATAVGGQTIGEAEDGVDGLGGGGGGGSSWSGTYYRCGGRGGNGAVILRIASVGRNNCVIQPARARSTEPCGLRSPWLANGLSSIRFTYVGADTNAVLLLQVSTNMTSYSEVYNRTLEIPTSQNWETIDTFTFTDTNALSGAKANYFSYRAPAKGLMRLIADPNVVMAANGNEDPNYGSVAITSILCYDEPPLDTRSWTGWNMWTVGWGLGNEPQWSVYGHDGHTITNSFAYLYDGNDGFSCSLNYSATAADNRSGINNTSKDDIKESDLTEPAKTEGDVNEYALSYPYVQGPAMPNGIGYVQFRARRDNALQDTPSVVTLFGMRNPTEPNDVDELTNIVVNSDRYSLYTWRTTEDHTGYQAIRLAVKGAAGTGGREHPDEQYYNGGDTPVAIQKLQRVWIDDVAFSESIAPRMAFLNARPFRTNLTETVIVPDILSEVQQPLTGESFGFQVQLYPQQLADDVNDNTIEVELAYYVGFDKWGWKNWIDDPGAVKSVLQRVGSSMVWRSTFDNPSSIVPAQSKPGTVVQYFFRASYKDNSGLWHTNQIDSVDWAGGPEWYWPVDYNQKYGGGLADGFSPYTLLDSISPHCAWFNEVNYYDGTTSSGSGWTAEKNQFIEMAVPADKDMSGWYVRVQNRNKITDVFFVIGSGGIAPSTMANQVNHYSFLTVASPKTYEAGTLGDAPSGKWLSSSRLEFDAEIANGELLGNSPYAFELIRPSGVIEHQIVVEGFNRWEGQAMENYGSGTNLCAQLQANVEIYGEGNRTNHWFFAGADKTSGTLAVFRSRGEDASCWTNNAGATPAMINSTVGQDGSEWFLPLPSGEFAWIYATILGKNMQVKNSQNVYTNSAVFMVAKESATNVTFKVDPWYQIGSLTMNGVSVPEAIGKTGIYELPVPEISTTLDIHASAEVASKVTSGIDPTDLYFDAVFAWLKKKYGEHPEWGDEIKPARFIGLSGTVTNEMSLKQMYWLDMPPTEGGWILRAGMGGGLQPPGSQGRLPVEPVYHNRPDVGLVTNVRMTVFLQITNDESGVCYAPNHLQGLEPGSTSYDSESGVVYTGSPNWTSVTFKVTGALQNSYADNTWVPLRWFVFGPDSFGAPGTPEEYTATIEIDDPFTKSSPAYTEGWRDYPGTPVFYSWSIDERRRPQSVEMLKKDSTYSD